MKVLVIGAGAAWSTKDVENGVVEGLRHAGLEVGRYAYDHRLGCSSEYLEWVHRRARKQDPTAKDPSAQDIQLHALSDVLPRALAHQTDWVVIVSAMFVPQAMVDVFQRAGLPVAIVLTESPYDIEKELQWARFADLAWTTERSSVEAFAAVAPAARYLRHAVRPTVHRPGAAPGDDDVTAHDVVFVGSCFDEREEWLNAINWDGIDLGLYGNWQRLSKRSPLRRFVHQGIVDNLRTAALYRRAKIGLNLYRESKGWATNAPRITHAESLNPRGYELAATGCFHLSSARAEVRETFGALVPTFTTPAECESLIRRWLSDDIGRRSVASQLPACVTAHTWNARGAEMRQALEDALPLALDRIAAQVETKRAHLLQGVA